MVEHQLMESVLSVRRLQKEDIPYIVNYWLSCSDDQLEKMGADKARLPDAAQFQLDLQNICNTPDEQAKNFYLIWLVKDLPIGFSSLKNISHGENGEMHLHIWNENFHGKGYGAHLFCLSVLDFYDRFRLEIIKCEPRASNPLPNRMLQKIGFPLIKSFVGASSELSLACELNQYSLPRSIAEEYLANLQLPYPFKTGI
jgi:RimJ/RimL family protein N-acetyltransferase